MLLPLARCRAAQDCTEDKTVLKNELVKTGRTASHLGSNHVVNDMVDFDQFDLHVAASVKQKNPSQDIKYHFVCS